MSKKFYQFGANDDVTQPADLAAKQEKIYTTSSTATFTAPSTVTVTSGSTSKTLSAQYSGLTLVDGDWICNVYFEGNGVAEDVEFSTSDGGHTESETSVNFGTQSLSIVIDQTTFTGSVAISATRTSAPAFCGAEADKTPTEDSNKLVTSGGVYDAVEAAIAADVTHAKSISAAGVSTPCEPDEDGDVDVTELFSGENTSLIGVCHYATDTATTALADRTCNAVTVTSAAVTLAFPAEVTGKMRDFLAYIDASAWASGGSLTVTTPTGATILGDGFPAISAICTYLVAVTEVASNTFYVRAIKIS